MGQGLYSKKFYCQKLLISIQITKDISLAVYTYYKTIKNKHVRTKPES